MEAASRIESVSVADAVAATRRFLEPALQQRDSPQSITLKIAAAASSDEAQPDDEARRQVIREACSHLVAIHEAVIADQTKSSRPESYDSSLLGAVYNLLDLLILEGAYPSLPAGVGSPKERRAKSLLWRANDFTYSPIDLGALPFVLKDALNLVAAKYNVGIEPMQRHNALKELIAINVWVARSQADWKVGRDAYLDHIPTPILYRALTSLLKPGTPEEIKSSTTAYLALLPERKDGVRHTIDYIAYSHPANGTLARGENPNPSQGPNIPVEVLEQASKLLSSVPNSTTPEAYFSHIAPQLLHLLDGTEGPELSRASAFIISRGILSKRSLGAPNTIGWKLFAEPQLQIFRPGQMAPIQDRRTKSDTARMGKELVSYKDLKVALNRLNALVNSHPSPSLTGRLLSPIILPLWGLANYSSALEARSDVSLSASSLFDTFFRLSGNTSQLQLLSENLVWDGTADWKYGPSGDGRVAIRERERENSDIFDIAAAIPDIDRRVCKFVQLLSPFDPTAVGSVFLNLTKQWLLPQSTHRPDLLPIEANPIKTFAKAKLAQAVLEKFQDTISKQPDQVLELIEQILLQQQQVQAAKVKATRQQSLDTPTYNTLSKLRIVQEQKQNDFDDVQLGMGNESEEISTVAISLFNAILSSSDFKYGKDTASVIQSIQDLFMKLSNESTQPLSSTVKLSIETALSLIQSARSNTNQAGTVTENATLSTEQALHQTLSEIAYDLSSDLPPIRNSALYALQTLIKTDDLPVDTPTVILLLLHTLRTDPEEFVFLAAIRTLVELAVKRDLHFTIKLTTEAFSDVKEEAGVDGRLRVGEVLNSIIEAISGLESRVSESKKHYAVNDIVAAVLPVAGRRGKRKREIHEQQQRERLKKRRKREAERAWGGEVPELPDEETDIDSATRERNRLELEAIEKIVKGWENTGFEEDVRVRTSALSILAQVLERCLDNCSLSTIESAADLALSTLTMELGPEKAILRRAAAILILSILTGMNDTPKAENGNVRLDAEKWISIEKVLEWVIDTDDDELVVDHAQAVVDGLEAWRMNQILKTRETAGDGGGLSVRLRGLDINSEGTNSQTGVFKRIEELD